MVGERVEQRELDQRTLAGPAAPDQRFEDGGVGGFARGDVAQRNADARGVRAFCAGDGRETDLGLKQQVIGLAITVRRARRIARNLADDQPPVALAKLRPAEPEAGCGARREVLDEDVGAGDHGLDKRAVGLVLQVHPAAFLAAVDPDEIGRLPLDEVVVAAGEIAVLALELHHPRAGVGEPGACKGSGDRLLHRDDKDPVERAGHKSYLIIR